MKYYNYVVSWTSPVAENLHDASIGTVLYKTHTEAAIAAQSLISKEESDRVIGIFHVIELYTDNVEAERQSKFIKGY